MDVVSASIGITVADTNSSGDFAAAFQGGELGLSVMAFRYDFLLDQWSDSVEVDEHSLGVDVGDIEMLESGDIVVSYAKGTAPTVAATSAWNSVTGTWQEPHEVPATFEIGAQLGPDLAESSDGGLMMIWEDWAGGLESVFSLTAGVDVPWAEATVADFYASKHTRQVFGLAGGGYGVLEQDYAPGEPRDLRLWRWTESGGWVLAGTILEQVLGGMSRNRVGAGAIVWTSGDPDALTHVTLVDLATGELGVEVALASGERVTRSHLTDQGDVLLVVERDRGSVTEFSARHFDGNTGAWGESYDFASESPETVAVWFGFGSDHAGNAHLVWTRGVGTNPELIWSVFDAEHQVWREGEVIRTADEALHWGLLHASSGGAVFLTETRQEPQAAPFHRVEVWR